MSGNQLFTTCLLTICAVIPAMSYATHEPIAPEGIKYVIATDAANNLAVDELKTAFSGNQVNISDLMTKGVEISGKVLLGVYLSQILANNPSYIEGSFAGGEYQIPLSKKDGVIIHAKLLAIDKQRQVKMFTELFSSTYKPSQPVTIRKLTKDEMAMIWFYISWDLDEPIYVVESGGKKLVFEFDPSGSSLTWIEDITEPCFRLAIGAGGLPCMCQVIVHEGNQYHSGFRPMNECKESSKTN
jgi:hypothetical protein